MNLACVGTTSGADCTLIGDTFFFGQLLSIINKARITDHGAIQMPNLGSLFQASLGSKLIIVDVISGRALKDNG